MQHHRKTGGLAARSLCNGPRTAQEAGLERGAHRLAECWRNPAQAADEEIQLLDEAPSQQKVRTSGVLPVRIDTFAG